MNTAPVTLQPSTATRRLRRAARRVHPSHVPDDVRLRQGRAADAPAIHALIEAHLVEGHLLPRSLDELNAHAPRFVVVTARRRHSAEEQLVGCAELAPLSASVAEVRSLVVDRSARSRGLGRRLLDALQHTARLEGFDTLCAFTHDAAYFVRKGFSIVPHVWVPEKIARDCSSCALFRTCGQYAVVLALKG
jgi:amino-acid N-acetyltransferase